MTYYPSITRSYKEGRQFLRFALGIVALSVGALVYLIDRPADTSHLISESISLFDRVAPLFGAIGNHLPTFSHVFAFILITAAVTAAKRSAYLILCAIWLLIDALFELGQLDAVSHHIASNVPTVIAELPLVSHTIHYFQHGRFDPIDLVSIILGAGAAYGMLLLTEERG